MLTSEGGAMSDIGRRSWISMVLVSIRKISAPCRAAALDWIALRGFISTMDTFGTVSSLWLTLAPFVWLMLSR